ncbi:MAG: endonuclease/exonuclease/phosphatase family protein [Actinomycetota bacterium]
MRLVTWNVQTARPNPDGPPDVDRVVAHLRALDADVVALQELDRGMRRSGEVDQAEAVAVGLGGHLVWAPTVRRGRGTYGHGLVVVRGEVVRVRDVALGGTREPRTLLVVELDHEDRRWTVGATHLSRRRRCATRQLRRCLDELAAHPAPRVLLGDLNLTPRHVLPWSTAAGFHLVDGPPTHDTRRSTPRSKIDHVLVSGARVDGAAAHRLDVSDHAAVSATLA